MKPRFKRRNGKNGDAARHQLQDGQPPLARRPQRESLPLKIDVTDGGIAFEVHVVPRSARSHVAGTHGDKLHVKVNAPPVEGAANNVVCATVARALGVPQRQVSIVRGVASRMKRIHVEGMSEIEARKALAADPT
ncbi:MAG: DUF167 domain-containing protein [Deltaproteobacteria bacterium]|nr:DUF167 domain-containing protein [Deltaproteobacteria bacterium]